MKQSPLSIALHVFALLIVIVSVGSLFTGIGPSVFNIEGRHFFFGYGDLLFHFALFHFCGWLAYIFKPTPRIVAWSLLVFLG